MRPRLTTGARAALAWCAAMVLGLGLAAAPPSAADPAPEGYFAVYAPPKHEVARAGAVPNDARFKDVQIQFVNVRPQQDLVEDVELVIDTTGAKDVAEFRFAADCAVAGAVATCPVGDVEVRWNAEPSFTYSYKVRAKAGAANGATGQVTYTARSANTPLGKESRLTTAVTVTEAADLVLTPPAQYRIRVPAGGSVPLPLEVSNAGSQTVPRTYLRIWGFDGDDRAELLGSYTNCWYQTRDPKNAKSPKVGAVCLLNTPLPADSARHVLSPPLKVGMGKYEEFSRLEYMVLPNVPEQPRGVRGTSGVLKLAPKPQQKAAQAAPPPREIDGSDNSVIVGFDTGQVADLAAAGATVKTRVGERFTAVVGVTNRGRATYRGPGEAVMVEIPRGLKVLGFDKRCKATPNTTHWENYTDPTFGDGPEDDAPVPTGALYRCRVPGELLPGIKPVLGFTLTATRTLDEARGVVFLSQGRAAPGRNNLGFLTVTATAAAGGTSGGGTGQTSGGSGTAGGTEGVTTGGSGDLAATGSGSTVPVALAAIGATGLGVIVFVVARRLRRRA
ncbi:hypothetical protein [Streptomyces sp. V1I1]|uniref:hypothetical protein n=1 Tax=Streptomyces sp. V1I1 TaxID=3042272 RepID=UPI00278527A8|nr:hypothetical protein [Streptomyces sp. V1I1]MDQ0938743.1 hypothetical protein [Streptomyces sp. V1I1]